MLKFRTLLFVSLGIAFGLLLAAVLFIAAPRILAQGPTPTPVAPAAAPSPAAPRAGLPPRIFRATILAVAGNTLTVATNNGTVNVAVVAQTRILRAGQTLALSDLHAGDHIILRGRNVKGVFTAGVINFPLPHVNGVVTAINGATLTISKNNMTATLVTDSQTVFMQGKQKIAQSDVKVGDRIGASGKPNKDGTFAAVLVNVNQGLARGRIQSIDGSNITVVNASGERTVVTTAGTTFFIGRVPGKLSDLRVGDRILARGGFKSDNTLAADTVLVVQKARR